MKQIKIVTEGEVNLLKERILQTLEKSRNIDQRKLAQIAHVNESSISRYLNGHDEINFEGVLRIVKYLYLEQEREIMSEYIQSQKSKNARYALEYCAMNHLWDLVEYLIGFLSESTNPVDKEWAAMYNFLLLRQERLISPMEQLDRIEVFKPKELEMKILRSILKAYVYYDLGERYSIFLHIKDIDKMLDQIKSTFIRDSFSVRFGLIMSYVYLHDHDIEKSREYSSSILKQSFFDYVKGTANLNLGISYLFENYQKASDYLSKAQDFFIYHNRVAKVTQVNLNLAFLQSYWDIDFPYTLALEDKTCFLTFIYYLIKKGESALALEHINRIHVGELSEWDKAFYFYYKGLLTQDKTTYYDSVESFSNCYNFFHIQLPLMELQKLGENETALRILSRRRRK